MLSTNEALRIVLSSVTAPVSRLAHSRECCGSVLAEDIASDIDMPPFDRSAMDGFALNGDGPRYELLPPIHAGDSPGFGIDPGQAAPIMTGAPVPPGAERVAMVESSSVDGNAVLISPVPQKGENICFRGEDIREGDRVLRRDTVLAPQHLGIAAMAGREALSVFSKPEISLMTTGSEVVRPSTVPVPGQVRNANMILMQALLERSGFSTCHSSHSSDDRRELLESMTTALQTADFLLVAGGVSLGKRDFVPGVMEELGVELLFGSVAQKPGKPLKFGLSSDGRLVFGLPGNPVSVLVCLEEYVIPALRQASGFPLHRKRDFTGRFMGRFMKKPGRTGFLRVRASLSTEGWDLTLPETSGSGDLMSTRDVNALAIAHSDCSGIDPGEPVLFHMLSATSGELAFE